MTRRVPSHLPAAAPITPLPVAIDYPAALAIRQMPLVDDSLPKCLLAIEVSALLHYVPDLNRQTLLATLWNCGGRIWPNKVIHKSGSHLRCCYANHAIPYIKSCSMSASRPETLRWAILSLARACKIKNFYKRKSYFPEQVLLKPELNERSE